METDSFGPLVDADWLRAHAGDPDVRVIDMRWYLGGRRGADEYARGHVPGAVFIDLETELTARSGPGRHPIPDAAQMTEAMQRAGVDPTTRVVAYDDAGGSVAARLWWLLRYYGHQHVAVLDGGLPAWTAAGGALEPAVPAVARGSWVAGPPAAGWTVDTRYVAGAVGVAVPRGGATVRLVSPPLLLDARAPERYRGEVEPIDARPGHVPTARSAPWAANLGPDGRFKSPEELRSMYEAHGVGRTRREVIAYCGSGVTACHDLLAIERAGLPAPKLYEGSWSDWARDPALPAATGEEGGRR